MTTKYGIIKTSTLGRTVEKIACRDGLTETGNSLIKSLNEAPNKGGEPRIYPAS